MAKTYEKSVRWKSLIHDGEDDPAGIMVQSYTVHCCIPDIYDADTSGTGGLYYLDSSYFYTLRKHTRNDLRHSDPWWVRDPTIFAGYHSYTGKRPVHTG